MTLSEACAKYFYKDTGLMMGKDFVLDGNPLLYTSEYYVLKFLLGESEQSDKENFERTVRLCYETKGILNRHPWDDGQEQHDDYLGVFSACVVLGCEDLGKEIYEAGNYWRWDNKQPKNPKWSQWFYRHPGFSCIAKLAAGIEPNRFDKALFKARILWDIYTARDGASGTIISWLMCISYLIRYGKDKDIDHWFDDIKRYGGLGFFLLDYFKSGHPFVECVFQCKSKLLSYF